MAVTDFVSVDPALIDPSWGATGTSVEAVACNARVVGCALLAGWARAGRGRRGRGRRRLSLNSNRFTTGGAEGISDLDGMPAGQLELVISFSP